MQHTWMQMLKLCQKSYVNKVGLDSSTTSYWTAALCCINKAFEDDRLCPRCATHGVYLLFFIAEQNLVEIDAVVLAVRLSSLKNTHNSPQSPLCENMTSSTKPEVHNVSQRRQWRNETRPLATRAQRLVKFGSVIFELFERTDRQTDRETQSSQYCASLPGAKITISCNPTDGENSDTLIVTISA